MTEQPDTTAIRAKLSSQSMRTLAPRTIIRGLCDALDAARDFEKASERWAALYARAEAAEARLEMSERNVNALRQERDIAETRIDKALALYPEGWEWNGGQGGGRLPSVADIRRALTEGTGQ